MTFSLSLDKLPWSCEAYNAFVGGQDGSSKEFEEALRKLYPPMNKVLESRPASVVDKYGVFVLVYAPGAIKPDRQVSVIALQ